VEVVMSRAPDLPAELRLKAQLCRDLLGAASRADVRRSLHELAREFEEKARRIDQERRERDAAD
jgi:hypothetical protein